MQHEQQSDHHAAWGALAMACGILMVLEPSSLVPAVQVLLGLLLATLLVHGARGRQDVRQLCKAVGAAAARRTKVLSCALLVGAALAFSQQAQLHAPQPTWSATTLFLGTGYLEEEPQPAPGCERWLVRLEEAVGWSQQTWQRLDVQQHPRIAVEIRQPPSACPGALAHWRQRVSLVGRLGVLADRGSTPGAQYHLRRLRLHGVSLCLEVPDPQHVAVLDPNRPGPVDVLAGWRLTLGQELARRIPGEDGALLRGIVLGDGRALTTATAQDFRTTGTFHVVAASGLNVALVGGSIGAVLCHAARFSPASAALLELLGVWLYAALAGASPSVVRAALLASVAALGTMLGRPARLLPALGWAAAVMMAWDPTVVLDLGFALSVACVLGIHLWSPPLEAALRACPLHMPQALASWVPARCLGSLRSALAASLAAQMAALPFEVVVFGNVPLVAPLANLVVVPPCELALVLGMPYAASCSAEGSLATSGSPICAGLAAVNLVLGSLERGLLCSVRLLCHRLACVPGASLQLSPAPPQVGWLCAALLIGSWWHARSRGEAEP